MKLQFIFSALVLGFAFSHVSEAKKEARQVAQEVSAATLKDTVKKLREDDEGIVVLFEKDKGSYYLRRDLAEFDACKKQLEVSLKSKAPNRVSVTVSYDSAQLNILEVK